MLLQVLEIVRLHIKLEWRKRQSFLAVLLYVVTTVYLSYLLFLGAADVDTWNSLYWIILIFAAIQAAFRSFQNEADRRFILYYQMVRPQVLIIGKTLYNFIYLFGIGLVGLLVFLFFLGNPISNLTAFLVLLLLASAGFSAILTMVSAISAKASDNPALPAILSIPLLYPQIITLSQISKRTLTGFSWEINSPYLLVILLLAFVSTLLGYILFNYLWRD